MFAAVAAAILSNCNVSDNSQGPSLTLSSATLFPFQNKTNWWMYTETGGNKLSISMLDTITDNQTTYYKVSFAEENIDTTDNWFRRSSLGVEYSPSLVGTYFVFLPPTFTSRQGTFSLSSTDVVSYSYANSLLVNGKYRDTVMEVDFPNRNIHNFDEIDFANNLGIVRMIDSSGRFPVVYSLDSARINGVIYK